VAVDEMEEHLSASHNAAEGASSSSLVLIEQGVGSQLLLIWVNILWKSHKTLAMFWTNVLCCRRFHGRGTCRDVLAGAPWPITVQANSAYSMIGWKAPGVITEWQRTVQILTHVIDRGVLGTHAEIFAGARSIHHAS
jgi:hypothetical protein